MNLVWLVAIISVLCIPSGGSTVFTTTVVTSTRTILVTPSETIIVGTVTTQVSTVTRYLILLALLSQPRQNLEYSMAFDPIPVVPTTATCLYVEKRLRPDPPTRTLEFSNNF